MSKRERDEMSENEDMRQRLDFKRKKKRASVHKISGFDESACRELREAMNAALKPVQEKYGIKVHIGRARFTPVEITFQCKCKSKQLRYVTLLK